MNDLIVRANSGNSRGGPRSHVIFDLRDIF
ncbi:MAG: hypothetical protein ACI9H8_000203 [Lysobacterales bacterium]|jgi:hypothetical protein